MNRAAVERKPQGVQSATVALTVLKTLLEADGPLFLRQIAAGVGMASSNVYRYLVSFVDAGMVAQDPVSGRYDLGPMAIQLGLTALRRVDAIDIADQVLSRLVVASHADGHIALWGTAGPTVVRWRSGHPGVALRVAEGTVVPIMTSATGRCWAAYLEFDTYRPQFADELAKLARSSKRGRAHIRTSFYEQLDQIRRAGFSASKGELRLSIDALSAPVFDRNGQIALTLTLVGTSGEFDISPESASVGYLLSAAEETSGRLGAAPTQIVSHYRNGA